MGTNHHLATATTSPWNSTSVGDHTIQSQPPFHEQDNISVSGGRDRSSISSSSNNNIVCSIDSDEKNSIMEEASIATAPTQNTDLFGEAHAEDEDDATTIRSLDSMTQHNLLHITEDREDDGDQETIEVSLHPLTAQAPTAEVASASCSVSTAPSTADEASADYQFKSQFHLQHHHHQQHRRVPSWEVSPHNSYQHHDRGTSSGGVLLPPAFSPSSWGQQQHVASFRGDHQQQHPQQQQQYPNHVQRNGQQSWQLAGRYSANDTSLPFLPPNVGGQISPRPNLYRPNGNQNGFQYPLQQQQHQQQQQREQQHREQQQQRKQYGQLLPPTATPPRNGAAAATIAERSVRGHHRTLSGQSPQRQSVQPGIGGGGGGGSSGGNSRSSSEVLKTLLRKKACLYEPDTSRAVALVTWLVGRVLALEYGFFSRQQLQAGVHACVAQKIDAGIITRTKVNRCMQIILNSCFHYIIPRPDGTEECGEAFRGIFAKEMQDDSYLLSLLPSPWNDITVRRRQVVVACQEEAEAKSPKKSPYTTPQSSPRLGSMSEPMSPGKDSVDGDNSEGKRAVLLCFNENVRRAEDVFRCHNEFIRDTAHACNLQLSSNEWRLFFGKEAARTPHLWGNVGIPVPFLEGQSPSQTDALGVWTKDELCALRTTWCSKRYEHDHELCGFAHPEVNGGWLRRNPMVHNYKDELCQYVTSTKVQGNAIFVNECPYGVNCDFAHSIEEIVYHPWRYKHKSCSSLGRAGGCPLGNVCPNFHPADSYRFPKKSDGRSPRHSRQSQNASGGGKGSGAAVQPPHGAPMLYASPAPVSSFERHLIMPGLQSLFRRNASVMRKYIRAGGLDGGSGVATYNCFGDDDGVVPIRQQQEKQSQPSTSYPMQKLVKPLQPVVWTNVDDWKIVSPSR